MSSYDTDNQVVFVLIEMGPDYESCVYAIYADNLTAEEICGTLSKQNLLMEYYIEEHEVM